MEVKMAEAVARAVETAELPAAEASSLLPVQVATAAAVELEALAASVEEEEATLARAA